MNFDIIFLCHIRSLRVYLRPFVKLYDLNPVNSLVDWTPIGEFFCYAQGELL